MDLVGAADTALYAAAHAGRNCVAVADTPYDQTPRSVADPARPTGDSPGASTLDGRSLIMRTALTARALVDSLPPERCRAAPSTRSRLATQTGLLGRDRDRLPPSPGWMVRAECVP